MRDLLAAAIMEYKLPDCRVRLASTRALLNEDAEAFLLRNREIEFEERLLEIPVEGRLLLNIINIYIRLPRGAINQCIQCL